MFFKRWFKRERPGTGTAAAATSVPAAAVCDEEPARTATGRETRVARPHRPRDDAWFTKSEIAALKHVRDEKQLAQIISRKVPGASRAEVLFRYYLSRAIFLGEFELPLLPQSCAQVLTLSQDSQSEIRDYVRVIGADPSLVRAVVDTANSSFFASISGSSTLEQAIVRIGLRQVEQITMLHAMRSKIFRVPGFESLIRSLVDHSLAVAVAGQVLAPKVLALPADSFLAGMFHDVGKLVLVGLIGDVQKRLDWKAPPALVASCFETYHISFGEIVCRHWKFPVQICEAVGSHHDATQVLAQPLDRAIYVANLLAHSLKDEELAKELVADPVVQGAGLVAHDLDVARSQLEKELQAYQALGF